jgi:hypothetical protein
MLLAHVSVIFSSPVFESGLDFLCHLKHVGL